MMASQKLSLHLLKSTCLQARCVAFGLMGFTMHASAQWNPWSTGSTSADTFGGDPGSNALISIPSDTDDWTRHFRIGAMVGINISANFSEKGTFDISGNKPASGVYDNGYLKPDQSGDPNYTSNWGYDKVSQYDSAAQTLTMQSASQYSTTGNSKDEAGAFPGFEMAYGDNLWYWKHARVGWEFGFGLLPISIKDDSVMSATVSQKSYVFSTSGLNLFPDPGYQGGSSGQGPLLPTAFTTSTNSSPGTITGSRTLDALLYTFRLGPTFYWDLTDDFGMSLGAGPALGLVSGTYKYNEIINYNTTTTTSVRNTGQFESTEVIYGGYVNGTLMYHVLDNADIYLSAEYMPLGNASINSGGRQAELNLGGQIYVSLGVNWPF